MNTAELILKFAQSRKSFTTGHLAKVIKLSRQTLSGHLAVLVTKGLLQKTGSTRAAVYSVSKSKTFKKSRIVLHKQIFGLMEDKVFSEVEMRLALRTQISSKAHAIYSYAFTEMLNNAIDHSKSKSCEITAKLDKDAVYFSVRDFGVGAFKNVQVKTKLKDEFEALEHIFKGKQTTDPSRHSGEGIFFTSRIADRFALRSHRLEATRDNLKDDIFVKDTRNLSGTEVSFHIKRRTRKELSKLFNQFTDANFKFDKNVVSVKISSLGGSLSRSQARRILFGLDKFREITFDFSGVTEIGQGFADEIFRVFPEHHPKITVLFSNTSPATSFMISRAIASRK